jgi:hypothetical protein
MNNLPKADEEDFGRMAVQYLDGTLSSADLETFNLLLEAKPDYQTLFVDLCLQSRIYAEALRGRVQLGMAEKTLVVTPAANRQWVSQVLSWGGIAAAIVALTYWAVVALTLGRSLHPSPAAIATSSPSAESGDPRPNQADSVAIVRNATGVRWSKNTSSQRAKGSVLPGERLKIESGTVELELNAGTKLVVEGPADWTVDDNNSVSLRAGRLLATVPTQAIGFSVQTPTAKIVDLGTEFGVDVDERGEAEVHVFQGRVVAERAAAPGSTSQRIELSKSEAARFTQDQTLVSGLSAAPERFSRGRHPIATRQVRVQPSLLGGLQLWLKADGGVYSKFSDDGDLSNDVLAKVGDRVQAWRDFSDYHRDAVQNTDSAQPTLIANKQGWQVLHFSGDDWLERAGEVLPPKNTDFTIFIVFEPATLPTEGAALFGQFNDREGSTSRYLALQPNGRFLYDEYWGTGRELFGTIAGSIAKDRVYVSCILRQGGQRSIKIHRMGDTILTGDSVAEDYTGPAPDCWRIGARQLKDNPQLFCGDIAELLAFDRSLDDKSVKHLETYLLAKYLNKSSDGDNSREPAK